MTSVFEALRRAGCIACPLACWHSAFRETVCVHAVMLKEPTVSNWMIDNRTTKLVSVLKEQLQADSELSLMLKNLSLSGFAALYDQLKGCKARLLLGMDDQPLTKRMACQPGEEQLSQQLIQKQQATALLKWLENNITAKGVPS